MIRFVPNLVVTNRSAAVKREHLSGSASPTERTMAWLRSQGYTVDKVEQRVAFGRTTRDLFGFIDLVAIKAGEIGVLGVQATTSDHEADRRKKIAAEPRAKLWLDTGNRLWLIGWRKHKEGRRWFWGPRVHHITVHDLLAL